MEAASVPGLGLWKGGSRPPARSQAGFGSLQAAGWERLSAPCHVGLSSGQWLWAHGCEQGQEPHPPRAVAGPSPPGRGYTRAGTPGGSRSYSRSCQLQLSTQEDRHITNRVPNPVTLSGAPFIRVLLTDRHCSQIQSSASEFAFLSFYF